MADAGNYTIKARNKLGRGAASVQLKVLPRKDTAERSNSIASEGSPTEIQPPIKPSDSAKPKAESESKAEKVQPDLKNKTDEAKPKVDPVVQNSSLPDSKKLEQKEEPKSTKSAEEQIKPSVEQSSKSEEVTKPKVEPPQPKEEQLKPNEPPMTKEAPPEPKEDETKKPKEELQKPKEEPLQKPKEELPKPKEEPPHNLKEELPKPKEEPPKTPKEEPTKPQEEPSKPTASEQPPKHTEELQKPKMEPIDEPRKPTEEPEKVVAVPSKPKEEPVEPKDAEERPEKKKEEPAETKAESHKPAEVSSESVIQANGEPEKTSGKAGLVEADSEVQTHKSNLVETKSAEKQKAQKKDSHSKLFGKPIKPPMINIGLSKSKCSKEKIETPASDKNRADAPPTTNSPKSEQKKKSDLLTKKVLPPMIDLGTGKIKSKAQAPKTASRKNSADPEKAPVNGPSSSEDENAKKGKKGKLEHAHSLDETLNDLPNLPRTHEPVRTRSSSMAAVTVAKGMTQKKRGEMSEVSLSEIEAPQARASENSSKLLNTTFPAKSTKLDVKHTLRATQSLVLFSGAERIDLDGCIERVLQRGNQNSVLRVYHERQRSKMKSSIDILLDGDPLESVHISNDHFEFEQIKTTPLSSKSMSTLSSMDSDPMTFTFSDCIEPVRSPTDHSTGAIEQPSQFVSKSTDNLHGQKAACENLHTGSLKRSVSYCMFKNVDPAKSLHVLGNF